ncbi:MAG: multicopper oxidase domain-containing protein [Hormoscilla sp. SP12CHS1]|nr:multicopper oxidase domain-containing protein [Hormoscilla sp. SP12CHS1]
MVSLANKLGNHADITEIFPASAKTLDMIADDPGTWMYHCHVNDHLNAGMMTLFAVEPIS